MTNVLLWAEAHSRDFSFPKTHFSCFWPFSAGVCVSRSVAVSASPPLSTLLTCPVVWVQLRLMMTHLWFDVLCPHWFNISALLTSSQRGKRPTAWSLTDSLSSSWGSQTNLRESADLRSQGEYLFWTTQQIIMFLKNELKRAEGETLRGASLLPEVRQTDRISAATLSQIKTIMRRTLCW